MYEHTQYRIVLECFQFGISGTDHPYDWWKPTIWNRSKTPFWQIQTELNAIQEAGKVYRNARLESRTIKTEYGEWEPHLDQEKLEGT